MNNDSFSAFAGNPLLISLDKLMEDGLISKKELQPVPDFPIEKVDQPIVASYKKGILNPAFHRIFDTILSIVVGATFIHETVGPVLSKAVLKKTGEIVDG